MYRGRDGLAEVLRSFADAWGEFRFEPERFLDAGDRVVVLVRLLARGAGSGVPIELKPAHVWTLRADRATFLRLYRDRAEALEAAGLRDYAMSRENVEIVRLMIAAFVEDDYERLVELFDPQIEYDVSRTSHDSRVAHGHEELAEVIEQWLATWDDHRLELVELIDAGDERVVALMRERGKMKGSDTWVEHQVGVLFTLRDGRITRYEEYQDKAGALEAAGLRE